MTEQTIYVDGGFMCERSRSITNSSDAEESLQRRPSGTRNPFKLQRFGPIDRVFHPAGTARADLEIGDHQQAQ